jgi:hypothetical protein
MKKRVRLCEPAAGRGRGGVVRNVLVPELVQVFIEQGSSSVGQQPLVGPFLKLAQKYLDIIVNHFTIHQKLMLT